MSKLNWENIIFTAISQYPQTSTSVKPEGIESCTQTLQGVGALQRHNTQNSKPIFPDKELRGIGPNFNIHVSVSDLYSIQYSHHRSACSAAGKCVTDPGNI
jgi:hypothetical protein